MQLVIVESPTKARKLSSYLGGGFMVRASVGHIRDLPKSKLGVDIDNNFEPTYEMSEDKKKVIKELKDLAGKAEKIILATDPDREGEAIAWHIQYLLQEGKSAPAKNKPIVRATFHEITKQAVMKAIEKPGEISQHLVDAQQARRVVDRLVGYQISPVLWRKVRRGLSAGRVQSVALKMIVEREREIEIFKPDEYWEIEVAVSTLSTTPKKQDWFEEGKLIEEHPLEVFTAQVQTLDGKKYQPKTEADVTDLVAGLPEAAYQITQIEQKQRRRVSLPPFTTSTLQQQAATRLGMTSKQSMRIAQQLYEEGLITYHRTDSVNLSQQSLEMARQFIAKSYGESYLPEKPRFFKSKAKNSQEAHEAIRVTDLRVSKKDIAAKAAKLTDRHAKLYDLIWRRFLASQMEAAVYDQTAVEITATMSAASKKIKQAGLKTNGSVLTFDGWMKLFPGSGDNLLPELVEHQELDYLQTNAQQKFTQPPPRYNDASLVKELEKRGIGRPSTYASIISVILDRGYVDRLEKRFHATPVGMTVSDFLEKYFNTIMDYDFTAEMEEDLDRVSRGEKAWRTVVKNFYQPLEEKIDFAKDKADRAQVPVEKTGDSCPDCGPTEKGEVVIRTGRFGKFKSCSRYPECKFTENIVEKIDGQQCPLCDKGDIIIKKTRWGKPFFGCGRYPDCDWASWQKPEPGLKVTADEWAEQQAARKERMAKRKKTGTKKTGTKKTKKTGKTTKKKKA